MKWTTRKAEVASGEYTKATVTEHVSEDGRFIIRPVGGMRYCRTNGFRGQMLNRWVWTGYRLLDNAGLSERSSTIKRAKHIAERRAAR